MSEHFKGCWQLHPACAVAHIRILEAQIAKLQPKPDVVHLPRPTWAVPCDDPPSVVET